MARPKSDKSFTAMLRIAIHEKAQDGKGTRLRALADKLVEEGIAGNVTAIKEIADRLDGKPVQPTDNMHEGEMTLNIITGVPRGDNSIVR